MIVENRLSLRGVNDFGKSRSRFCALRFILITILHRKHRILSRRYAI